jgi:recombination protein RecT
MVAGIMKLVRNSGEISTWSVQAVYKNDNFDFSLGDEEHISHKPALSSRGELIAVYSIVTMKDGEKSREVMSVEDVNAIRARSRSGKSGPWVSDFAEMAKKTVIRRHSKRLPLSTDIEGVLKDDDEMFMPAPEVQPMPEEAPATPKRASRLNKVAEKAPAPDDDGVIDLPHREPTPETAGNADDSPI